MQDAFTGFSDKARTTLLISFEKFHICIYDIKMLRNSCLSCPVPCICLSGKGGQI